MSTYICLALFSFIILYLTILKMIYHYGYFPFTIVINLILAI